MVKASGGTSAGRNQLETLIVALVKRRIQMNSDERGNYSIVSESQDTR